MGQREDYVAAAKSYLGAKKGDARHKEILSIYNTIVPLPRGYKIRVNDAWCAAFVSAMAKKVGLTNFPFECSCSKMIASAIRLGIWIESDSYVPQIGELIMYDWNDDGIGDNKGAPNHVGIVVSTSGNQFTVIEGNKGGACDKRTMTYNGRYIRGFVKTKFAESKPKQTASFDATEKGIFKYLVSNGYTKEGAAGVMGNLFMESSLRSNNLQNSANKKLNMTDEQYTAAVDNGAYTNFVKDSAGYGLAQWTYWSLKQDLLTYATSRSKSIGDPQMQLDFLMQDVKKKRALHTILTAGNDVRTAAIRFMLDYEKPANKSESHQNRRAEAAMQIYNRNARQIQ